MSTDKIAPIVPQNFSSITPIRSLENVRTGSFSALGGSRVPFADMLTKAMQDVADTQKASDDDAYDLVMGTNSDLHSIMIRNTMETAAVETAVELTSRVVSVYKEIMQMQI